MMTWKILCVVLFVMLIQAQVKGKDEYPILVKDATAVCLDGTPAAYYHILGFGEGVNNWLVDLEGGAWCGAAPAESCQHRSKGLLGSSAYLTPINYFNGILSSDQTINPDFYNWNKIYVHYCDGSSFIGDTEIVNSGSKLQLRGSRIFNAVMDELLLNGMGNADYNLTSILPASCTSRRNASLCLFPEYLVEDVSTPLFLLNSAFDSYQIQNLLKPEIRSDPSWNECKEKANAAYCTPGEIQLIKDFGNTFLETIKGLFNNPSRGMFMINSCYYHIYTSYRQSWNSNESPRFENKTIAEAVGDWYFDRNPVKLITIKQISIKL